MAIAAVERERSTRARVKMWRDFRMGLDSFHEWLVVEGVLRFGAACVFHTDRLFTSVSRLLSALHHLLSRPTEFKRTAKAALVLSRASVISYASTAYSRMSKFVYMREVTGGIELRRAGL
jgi:hypothetical protein